MFIYNFVLVLALSLQIVGAYTIWFSRYNIVTHITAGFVIIAYIIPGLFTNYSAAFTDEVLDIYFWSSVLGSVAYLLGIHASRFCSTKKPWIRRTMEYMTSDRFERRTAATLKYLLIFAIVSLSLGYMIMGFVPMFAADPLSAKQFKGVYRDSYLNAAWIFRSGFMVAVFIMPIAAVYSFVSRKRWFFLASALLGALVLVSLAKGSAVVWLLVTGGVFAARRKKWFLLYMVAVISTNLAGSIFNYALSVITGSQGFINVEGAEGFAQLVAAGAPDMVDQLSLVDAFVRNGSPFTLGRTFFGGLVPFSFEWNPSVWTLNQLNDGADVTEIVSGGLRLPASLWGYVSFGWSGVILVPALSGFLLGYFIRVAKTITRKDESSIVLVVVTVVLYSAIIPISGFYSLSLYLAPALFISTLLLRRRRLALKVV